MMTPEDAALLTEAELWMTTDTPRHDEFPWEQHTRQIIERLAQSLRAALEREAELIEDAEQEFVVTGQIVERAEAAERERDTLAAQVMSRAAAPAPLTLFKGVELPCIERDAVDHARIALKTYISQWCAVGITAEVSELIHDLIRAAEVRGLNRGLPPAPASWVRTDC